MPADIVKLVFCIRRRPELALEEFARYWREQHGPLVRSLRGKLPMLRYVQSHTVYGPATDLVRASRGSGEAPFDGLAEVWFDASCMEGLIPAEMLEASILLTEDEGRFVDFTRSTVFVTREHVVFASDEG